MECLARDNDGLIRSLTDAMSAFSPNALASELKRLLPSEASGALCVAFSGGLDSTALLQAFSELREANPQLSVRAVHVDHGLHSASSSWQGACADFAHSLDIEYAHERVAI